MARSEKGGGTIGSTLAIGSTAAVTSTRNRFDVPKTWFNRLPLSRSLSKYSGSYRGKLTLKVERFLTFDSSTPYR